MAMPAQAPERPWSMLDIEEAERLPQRLLPQPHGFEGFVRVRDSLAAGDPARPDGVKLAVALVHVQPAAAASGLADEHDDVIVAGVDDPLDLDVPALPHVRPSGDVIHDRLEATAHLSIGKVRAVPLD